MKVQFVFKGALALFCALLLTGGWSGVRAQVALGSLDPSVGGFSPAASGWGMQKSVTASFGEGGGYRENAGTRVYELVTTSMDASASFPMQSFTLTLGYNSEETALGANQVVTPVNGGVEMSRSNSTVGLVIGNRDFVTVGLGSSEGNSTFRYDDLQPDQSSATQGVVGGFSMKFMEKFYAGAAFQKVTHKTDLKQDLRYGESALGVGMLVGSSTKFRLEAGSISHPSATSGTVGLDYNYEPKQSRSYVNLELMMQGLLFSSQNWTTNRSYSDMDPLVGSSPDEEVSVSENGVVWIPPSGVSLGFYFNTKTVSALDRYDSVSNFVIKAGYLF